MNNIYTQFTHGLLSRTPNYSLVGGIHRQREVDRRRNPENSVFDVKRLIGREYVKRARGGKREGGEVSQGTGREAGRGGDGEKQG